MKPTEPIPHNYSMRSLNWIFLWSSVVLLAVTALMVGYDYLRGWKWFQLEFMRMQRDRITQDMQRAEQDENGTQLTSLDRSPVTATSTSWRRRTSMPGKGSTTGRIRTIASARPRSMRSATTPRPRPCSIAPMRSSSRPSTSG